MVTSKALVHNSSHPQATPTRTCFNIPTHFWQHCKESSEVHCLLQAFWWWTLTCCLSTVWSPRRRTPPSLFLTPFVSISRSVYRQVILCCLFSVEFRCSHRLTGRCTLAWQRGHLARLSFLRSENTIVFGSSPLSQDVQVKDCVLLPYHR